LAAFFPLGRAVAFFFVAITGSFPLDGYELISNRDNKILPVIVS
jgi:hypothetical protein